MKTDASAVSVLLCALCACGSDEQHINDGDTVESARADTMVTYYVSPTGTGFVCSSVAPCRLDVIRSVVQSQNSGMTGDIVVEIAGGVYSLNQPFLLDERDSGSGGFKVIYKAAAGEVPVFRGGITVSGWTLHDSSANIYKAAVTEVGFRQIYVNGDLAIRAREPDQVNQNDFGPYLTSDFSVNTSTIVLSVTTSKVPTAMSNLNEVEVVFMPHWYHNRVRVETMTSDGTTTTITPREPERSNVFNKDSGFYSVSFYYFENAYELLDAEGEWYLDSVTSSLYYKPVDGQDMATAQVVVPVVDALLEIKGTQNNRAHDIEVRGITFETTTWEYPSSNGVGFTQGNQVIENESLAFRTPTGAIDIGDAYNIRLERNILRNIGGVGINLGKGTTNSEIVGNNLSDLMSNGIVLASEATKNPPAAEQVSGITIANNVIAKVGRQYTNGQGILASFVKDIMIEHNEIRDIGYSGVQIGQQSGGNIEVGMSNNIVQYNHIHNVMKLHDDGGGIYTLARQQGTHIFENWVHNVKKSTWASNFPIAGVYQDNYSEFITIERNVLENNTANTYQQTGIGAQNNTYISNDIQDQSVKDNAGLEPAYEDLDTDPPQQTLPPVISTLKAEAEVMLIANSTIESSTTYSNGQGVKPDAPAGNKGSASYLFGGASTTYDITVGYLEENDGQGNYDLYVGGVLVDSWATNLSQVGASFATRTVENVTVLNGDEIKITGTVQSGAHARMDYVELTVP